MLRDGREPELTLVTCHLFYYVGPAPKRYVVKARVVLPDSAAANGALDSLNLN